MVTTHGAAVPRSKPLAGGAGELTRAPERASRNAEVCEPALEPSHQDAQAWAATFERGRWDASARVATSEREPSSARIPSSTFECSLGVASVPDLRSNVTRRLRSVVPEATCRPRMGRWRNASYVRMQLAGRIRANGNVRMLPTALFLPEVEFERKPQTRNVGSGDIGTGFPRRNLAASHVRMLPAASRQPQVSIRT
jgi:hypothetical protein